MNLLLYIPRRTRTKYAIVLSCILFLFSIIFPIGKTPQSVKQNTGRSAVKTNEKPIMTGYPIATDSGLFVVKRVIDGDTIVLIQNNAEYTVRLLGIDTPEVVDPRKPVQCFGKEASEKTKAVLVGATVRLVSDPTQGNADKYNRLLRYVYLSDGTFFNFLLVREGFAHEYTYQNIPYEFQQSFRDAEKSAREEKIGLWADGMCN